MNDLHMHLLVNHVSLFSVLFGLVAFLWSKKRNSKDMHWAAIILFLLAGVFGWVAMETGEGAEEVVENLPGVTEALIHDHEEAGEFAGVLSMVLAVCAAGMIFVQRLKPQLMKMVHVVLIIVALMTFAAMARTALLGGQIRHTEIRDQ